MYLHIVDKKDIEKECMTIKNEEKVEEI